MGCSRQGKKPGSPDEKRVGVAAIIVEDRMDAAPAVNKILSEYGDIIVCLLYTSRCV